jgi:PD-(D/E)XK nuclease superfamily protein
MSSLRNLAGQYHVLVKADNPFQRKARILQSMWRQEKTYPAGLNQGKALGSRLAMPYAKNTLVNYLNDTIRSVVRDEVLNPAKKQDKLYGQPRIFDNLLSSQPLCFNLFAELQQDLQLATQVMSSLSNGRIHQVTAIEFEHSPGRGDERYTGDKSAFDVFVEYATIEGKSGFAGIEVKYHENMAGSSNTYRLRYDEIASQMDCFPSPLPKQLKKSPIEQLWRDHLLAGSMLINKDYDDGFYVFLYPEGNNKCEDAVTQYRSCLANADTFAAWTLESVYVAIKKYTDAIWIDEFYNRYLDFSKLKTMDNTN